ncbi:MAG: cytochrome c [Alphaproteobacteria bacterium]|nr:MAG: cytochrome c [Alphaproteobacteria bacterium]
MFTFRTFLLGTAAAAAAAGAVLAASEPDKATAAAIKARQSHMTLYAFNLGALGAMAKGERPYDAGAAQAAADNLAALVSMNQGAYWPAGSDSDSVTGTNALPKIWEDFAGVAEKGKALAQAVAELQEAAGMDLDSLRPAVGAVGKACGACHKAYRKPKE